MPAARRYVSEPALKEYRDLETEWRKEFMARQTQISKAWKYYDGDMQTALKPDSSKVDDNVIFNLIELQVEKSASSLMGSDEIGEVTGVAFEIGGDEGGQTEEDAAGPDPEEWLSKAWDANKKGILLHDGAINGGVCGHVFFKIVPQDGSKPPRLINLNPASVGAFWDTEDVERVLWYRIEYDVTRQDIVRNVNEDGSDGKGWTLYNYQRQRKTSDGIIGTVERVGYSIGLDNNPWRQVGEEVKWPYEWPPIVDWKNLPRPNSFYGKNDIGQNWRLNDTLNIVISYAVRILKYHANPKTVATGVTKDQIEAVDIANMLAISDSQAKVFNVEMQSDLSALLNIAQAIRRGFWDIVREIDSAMVQDKLGEMTNFDLRVLFRDSLAKLTTKRLTYGDGLRRICQHLLELGGFGPEVDINVIWPDPLPNDPVQQATALEKDVTVGGISQRTYQERRGYDPDKEALVKQEERAAKVQDQVAVNQGSQAGQLETLGRLMNMRQGGIPGNGISAQPALEPSRL